MIDVVDD